MFEDKNNIESDLMMRSILDGAQEEVPAGAWDEISARLDKASEKKVVALPWKRAAIGFGVAAAMAAAFMLSHSDSDDIVPAAFDSSMIAVVETPVIEEAGMVEAPLMAQAIGTEVKTTHETRTETREEKMTEAEPVIEEKAEEILYKENIQENVQKEAYIPFEWEEEPEKSWLNTNKLQERLCLKRSKHILKFFQR